MEKPWKLQVKSNKSNPKRQILYDLYEIPNMGKFIEKEIRLEITRENEKLLIYGHRVSMWSDENCWGQTVVVV